jgi:hypothetical protein
VPVQETRRTEQPVGQVAQDAGQQQAQGDDPAHVPGSGHQPATARHERRDEMAVKTTVKSSPMLNARPG